MKESKKPDTQTPPGKKVGKEGEIILKPLRTYEDDVRNAIYTGQISTAKILISEQTKKKRLERESRQEGIDGSSNKKYLTFGMVLLVIGLLVIVYIKFAHPLIFKEEKRANTQTPVSESTIIYIQEQIEIPIGDRSRLDIVQDLKETIKQPIEAESFVEIVFTKTQVETEDLRETKKNITTSNLFEILGTPISNRAIRSMNNAFILGIHGMTVSEPYIVIKVDDFTNSFAGMLEWESVLVSDVKSVFFQNLDEKEFVVVEDNVATSTPDVVEDNVATSTPDVVEDTSSSTPEIIEPVTFKKLNYSPSSFEDVVLSNRDTRVIRDFDGNIIFFYSFINEDFLIMTTNIDTFEEVIRRIQSKSLAQ
ncbi:MAG: hypothetical protein ACI9GH_000273 [Candidatus Paceibacteria bacterium]|jgi:hypothetical protein